MTEFNSENITPEAARDICAGTLMNCAGRVEEVAKTVVFLCGDGSSFITGETFEVSGGRGLTLNPMFSYLEKARKNLNCD